MVEDSAGATMRFRPLQPADLEAMHRLHGDPSTNAHNPFGASADLSATAETLVAWRKHASRHGFGYEVVELDGRVIGICGARFDEWLGRRVVNLYWRLLPEWWGRGLSGPLADHALVIARSRPSPGEEPVIARMLPANHASRRVAERIGLVRRPESDGELAGARWIVFAAPG